MHKIAVLPHAPREKVRERIFIFLLFERYTRIGEKALTRIRIYSHTCRYTQSERDALEDVKEKNLVDHHGFSRGNTWNTALLDSKGSKDCGGSSRDSDNGMHHYTEDSYFSLYQSNSYWFISFNYHLISCASQYSPFHWWFSFSFFFPICSHVSPLFFMLMRLTRGEKEEISRMLVDDIAQHGIFCIYIPASKFSTNIMYSTVFSPLHCTLMQCRNATWPQKWLAPALFNLGRLLSPPPPLSC